MLYICATPIGNLADITLRALEMLNSADIILCEDTRNSQKLLTHHGINNKKLIAFHEHNENEISNKVLSWLQEKLTIVQISDAGTPGISDPGARLCNMAYQNGIIPTPLPGACAYSTLLSTAGLIGTPSLFYGFLPAKAGQRQKQLSLWQQVDYAVCIYESPHRICECLTDINTILGGERIIVMGRELTKQFETIRKLPARQLLDFIQTDNNQQKGEFALLILPAEKTKDDIILTTQQIITLELLAEELPAKKAVNLAHKLGGGDRDLMYRYLLERKDH